MTEQVRPGWHVVERAAAHAVQCRRVGDETHADADILAGRAVAIPALFGYNYILSRVKDAKDDMHIFIDEFVTKMAEFYKEKGE